MMEYKGYWGRVEYDGDADHFHGEVINTRDVITFQGRSVKALKKAFRDSVEDYLAFCKERGEPPDKPCSGKFMLRIPPELHQRLYRESLKARKSLNKFVAESLQKMLP